MRVRSALIVGLALSGVAAGLLAPIIPGRGLQAMGIAAFGLAGFALGIRGLLDHELLAVTHAARFAQFEGSAARWASIPLLLLGAALVVAGLAWGTHAEAGVLGLVGQRPGTVLAPFGLGTMADGIARFLGFRLTRHPDRPLVRMRVGGPLTAVLGSAFLVLGLFELAAPGAFDSAFGTVLHTIVGGAGGTGP